MLVTPVLICCGEKRRTFQPASCKTVDKHCVSSMTKATGVEALGTLAGGSSLSALLIPQFDGLFADWLCLLADWLQ